MPTMTAFTTPSQRRARLKGEAAVARSRLETGAWIARLLAGLYLMGAMLLLVLPGVQSPRWPASVGLCVAAIGLLIAARGLTRGSRIAAAVLLVLTALGAVSGIRGGRVGLLGLLFNLAAVLAFANAMRGSLALARIERESRDADGSGFEDPDSTAV